MINRRRHLIRSVSCCLVAFLTIGFSGCNKTPAEVSSSSGVSSSIIGDDSESDIVNTGSDASILNSSDSDLGGNSVVNNSSGNHVANVSGVNSNGEASVPVIPTDLGVGKTYYVSSSSGNDNNDGLSKEKPFKTLAKINSISLQAGDNVLLKRGDTFKAEYLKPKGGGEKTTGKWITIDSYGSGNNPVLKDGINTGHAAISLSLIATARAYRIRNIDIDNYLVGICSVKSSMELAFDGLIIENCNIKNISKNEAFDPNPALPENAELCYGLRLEKAKNVQVNNVSFNHTDCPIRVRGELMTFDGLDIFDSRIQGVMIYGSEKEGYDEVMATAGKITFKNSKIINTGYAGLYLGTAGLMIELTKECLIQNVEIAYTTNTAVGDFDACAIDWEQCNINCTLDNVYAHDNDGPFLLAMEHDNTKGASRGNKIVNCISVNNGRRDHTAEGTFINHSSYANANQKITVQNCIDIGKPGSVPYTYESNGKKEPQAALPSSRINASGFTSGTIDVYEQFNINSLDNWNNISKVSVSNSHLKMESGAAPRAKFSGSDYVVSTYLKGSADLVFMETGSGSYVWSFANGKVVAQKKSNGKLSTLKTMTATGLNTNNWFHIRVEKSGNNINTYINSTLVGTISDSTFSSGTTGLNAKGTSYADEFFVYKKTSKTRTVKSFDVASANAFNKLGVISENGRHGWHLPEINWTPSNGIGTYIYRPFFVGRAQIKSANAYLQRNDANISVGENKTVSVLLNNLTTNGKMTFEYTKDGNTWYTKDFQVAAMSNDSYYPFANSGTGFARYYIDMSGDKNWSGTIKHIRLRFAASSGYVGLKDITVSK